MELLTNTEPTHYVITIDNSKSKKMTNKMVKTLFHTMMNFSPSISQIKYHDIQYNIDNHNDLSLLYLSSDDALDIEYHFNNSLDVEEGYLNDCIIEKYHSDQSDITKKDVFKILLKTLNKLNSGAFFDIDLCDQIMFKNIRGVNYDKRGTRDNILLPYHEKYTIDCPFTLNDFLTGYHKIKSHKFDYWYELFCNCNFKFDKINDLNTLIIECDFDHGS